jgi:alanine dehydrogenase
MLGLSGSGGMARFDEDALIEAHDIRRIQVYSPTPEHRRCFAADMASQYSIEVTALDHLCDVYRDADILAACTDSALPVLRGEWREPGMHVISIGGRMAAVGNGG